jgi:hypothetical protein
MPFRSRRERRSLAEGCSTTMMPSAGFLESCRAQINFRDTACSKVSINLDGPEAWGGPGRPNRSPGRRPVEVRPMRNFLCATVVVTLAISHGRRRCSLSAPCLPRSFSRCSAMAIPASARGEGVGRRTRYAAVKLNDRKGLPVAVPADPEHRSICY